MGTKDIFLEFDRTDVIFKELNDRVDRAEDMKEVRKESSHLVFVYGTLKKGLGNHHYLTKAKYLGRGYTLKSQFNMFDTGTFPVLRDMKEIGHQRVYGEVYSVTPDQMIDLDFLEGNGFLYLRNRHLIVLMDQRIENRPVVKSCWTYIGLEDTFDGFKDLKKLDTDKNRVPEAVFWD